MILLKIFLYTLRFCRDHGTAAHLSIMSEVALPQSIVTQSGSWSCLEVSVILGWFSLLWTCCSCWARGLWWLCHSRQAKDGKPRANLKDLQPGRRTRRNSEGSINWENNKLLREWGTQTSADMEELERDPNRLREGQGRYGSPLPQGQRGIEGPEDRQTPKAQGSTSQEVLSPSPSDPRHLRMRRNVLEGMVHRAQPVMEEMDQIRRGLRRRENQ